MINVSKFVKENIALCICTLGLAVVGYLGYHAVRWIITKCRKTEKIDRIAHRTISLVSQQRMLPSIQKPPHHSQPVPSLNVIDSNLPKLSNLSNPSPLPIDNKVLVDEIALKQKSEKEKKSAAVKIQKIWRGHSDRVKVEKLRKHLLSSALFEKAKIVIDNNSYSFGCSRAPYGRSKVYLHKKLPLVFKNSDLDLSIEDEKALKKLGYVGNRERVDKMRQARNICERNGYKSIVIPKARIYKDFIVETRLPIMMYEMKDQMGLYIENRARFTEAVKEFVGFLCQSKLSDITGNTLDSYGTLSETPMGRYDNVALYLEEDRAKIGLIDLEGFEPECHKSEKNWCFLRCQDAIRLFPYHLDEILDIAKNFDPKIHEYRKDLEIEKNGALKRFKIAYEDHLELIKKQGITFENPSEIKINSNQRENLKQAALLFIQKLHEGEVVLGLKDCLGETPEEVEESIRLFEQDFPKILDLKIAFLSRMLKVNIEMVKPTISSDVQLLSCRTVFFRDFFISPRNIDDSNSRIPIVQSEKWAESLEEDIAAELPMKTWEPNKLEIAANLRGFLFDELVKQGVIAYHNYKFGDFEQPPSCIFF